VSRFALPSDASVLVVLATPSPRLTLDHLHPHLRRIPLREHEWVNSGQRRRPARDPWVDDRVRPSPPRWAARVDIVGHLLLDFDLRETGLPNSNFWLWPTTDLEGLYARLEAGEIPDPPVAYVACATLKDPASPRHAPAGHTNLEVMTLVPHDYAIWHVARGPADGGRYHRDLEYRRRKRALASRVLEVAEEVVPDLRRHVEWEETATPVTQERFTRSTGGTS
jgi:phytoene dehydrogenase-like protein